MEITTKKAQEFKLIKNNDYSMESFQKFIFKDITIDSKESTSFHRADFRGSSMSNSIFKNTDFSRSDFIAMSLNTVLFENSSFESCTFLNNIFYNVIFKNNKTTSLDLLRSSFTKCKFEKEKFTDCTWNNLVFDNCEFTNFKIEKSTIQDIEFTNCILENLNFAGLTALNLSFKNCTLNNVIFDPDYLGSYCFDKQSLGNISYSYKEKIFKFDISNIDNIKDYSEFLFLSQRFAEVFGLSAILTIKNFSFNVKLSDIWINCFNESCKLENEFEASDNVKLLSKSLKFYFNQNLFNVVDMMGILLKVQSMRNKNLPLQIEENIFYIASFLREYIECAKYSFDSLVYSKKTSQLVYSSFTFNTDSFLDAEKELNNIFINILKQGQNSYYIVDSRKGSIIMIVLATLVSILSISKLLLSTQNNVFKFIINFKKFKNTMLLENKKTELINNMKIKKNYTMKDLIKLDNTNKLESLSELQVYIDESL